MIPAVSASISIWSVPTKPIVAWAEAVRLPASTGQ